MTTPSGIRTPDQRLRVFVSSTLREMATERKAVRRVIEELGLTAVMFELGARPHPPRELYRAYLAQSDIFVGLYAERYGWVAPGEDVSGLEDEYRLAPPDMPRLVYVKTVAQREPRLDALLDSIREEDRAAYVYFSGEEELAELVRGDLATLLSERFRPPAVPSAEPASAAGPARLTPPPSPLTRLIGRERELGAVTGLLRGGARLLTVTGPGGIGKSRLALDAAAAARDIFPDGVAFVDLSAVRDAAQVSRAMAAALGIHDVGERDADEKLRVALRDRRLLIVVDNFEQVADASLGLRDLLLDVPTLTLLVTSRVLLRIAGEQVVELGPLALPDADRAGPDVAARSAAVELFVERLRATRPDFALTADNAQDIVDICVALDGVPLAIELAAARARALSPGEILQRLRRRLPVLAGGGRDLPERQRTMHDTIDWSVQLLPPSARERFAGLGVFAGPFSLDAVEAVTGGAPGADVIDDLAVLVDSSLVRQEERGDRAVYTMLAAVREFAREQLVARGDAAELSDRHAGWFLALADRAERPLEGPLQREWIIRLAEVADDLRAAERHLLDSRRWADAALLAWRLYVYWWIGGHLGEVRGWMTEVLTAGDRLDDGTRAIALYFSRAIAFWQDPDESLVPDLRESAAGFRAIGDRAGDALALASVGLALLGAVHPPDVPGARAALDESLALFREVGDSWGCGLVLAALGRIDLLERRPDTALGRFDEALGFAQDLGDRLGESIARFHRGAAFLLRGDVEAARESFASCLRISDELDHDEGLAYGIEGLTAVAAAGGDVDRAGRLLGAAEMLRERTGLYDVPTFAVAVPFVEALRAGAAAADLEAARVAGRALPTAEAVAYALRPAGEG
ncbi:DUF4062 domain-containing protein [Microbacterium sp. JZ31]|uniref:DUF4062 domain-containing protein n=1 Tax=Microbacterium sp. JZ31 TaxID=1906274 RepID=UPI00193366DA|nr:DUF4062 domain-containing protein [Microbacterium sp. JZ31]